MRLVLLLLGLIGPGCGPRPPPLAPAVPEPTVQSARLEIALARSWYLKALVAEARRELEEAERSMKWMVRVDRSNPWVHVALGRFYQRQGRWSEAEDAFRDALDRTPEVPEAQLGLARCLMQRDPSDPAALQALRRAAAGGLSDAHAWLGDLLLEGGDEVGARGVHAAWSEQPLSTDQLRQRAQLALRLELWDAAARDLEHVVSRSEASVSTGRLFADAARRACRVDPVWRWARREQIERRGDRWQILALHVARISGDALWEEALLRSLGDPLPLAQVVEPEEALELLADADDPTARLVRAQSLLRLSKARQALAELDEMEPTHALLRVQVLHALGRDPLPQLRLQLAASPDDPRLLIALAEALGAADQQPGAVAVLASPVDWSGVLEERWRVLQSVDPQSAVQEMRSQLEQDPCHRGAALGLVRSDPCDLEAVEHARRVAPGDSELAALEKSLPERCGEE